MSEDTSVQTDSYPRIDIRRESDGVYDEDWRIVLAHGQPTEIYVRPVRTTPIHKRNGAVVKGDWEEAEALSVPEDVVAEVEEHMVPRGGFGTTGDSEECHNCGGDMEYHTVGHYYQCVNCKRTVLSEELAGGVPDADSDGDAE